MFVVEGADADRFVAAAKDAAAAPNLYQTTGERFLASRSLSEEVFGPLGLVVRVGSAEEMRQLAPNIQERTNP